MENVTPFYRSHITFFSSLCKHPLTSVIGSNKVSDMETKYSAVSFSLSLLRNSLKKKKKENLKDLKDLFYLKLQKALKHSLLICSIFGE